MAFKSQTLRGRRAATLGVLQGPQTVAIGMRAVGFEPGMPSCWIRAVPGQSGCSLPGAPRGSNRPPLVRVSGA